MTDVFYNANGKKISEVNFKGDQGIWKYYNTDASVSRSEKVQTRERTRRFFPRR